MRILAVDDEPIFLDLLTSQLEELGYFKQEVAHSGPQALDMIRDAAAPYECFLFDVQMVPMDGIRLVRNVRQIPQHLTTPILMISALQDKDSIDRAFLAGANDYITKPLDSIELKIRLAMAQSVLTERAQARLLQNRLVEQEQTRVASLRFDDPSLIDDVDCVIALSSMENFLLKQGLLRLRQCCAIGFHVQSAETHFQSLGPVYYMDLMADLATMISTSMQNFPHLMTYLGSGDLVAVLLDRPHADTDQIRNELDVRLDTLSARYAGVGTALPSVGIGEPMRVGLSPFECPTRLLERARLAARQSVHAGRPRARIAVA